MFIRCGRATVYSWRRLSPGVSNGLLNEDLSLAINGFVMRPRPRDLLSLLWYGLEHRRSEIRGSHRSIGVFPVRPFSVPGMSFDDTPVI
jgi:hypothetical protein